MATAADRGWGHPGSPGTASADQYRRQHIVKLDVGGIRLYIRREVAPIFAGFIHAITLGGFDLDRVADDWGYICRPIRGYETEWRRTGHLRYLSNHSWGLAVDLNATEHPIGRSDTGIPDWVVDEARRWGLAWGGDYEGRPDEMHFEVLLTPPQVKELLARLTAPTPAPPNEEPLMRYPEKGYQPIDITLKEGADRGRGGVHIPIPFDKVVSVTQVAAADGDLADGIQLGFAASTKPGHTYIRAEGAPQTVGVVIGYVR